jgi:hypothetical protein
VSPESRRIGSASSCMLAMTKCREGSESKVMATWTVGEEVCGAVWKEWPGRWYRVQKEAPPMRRSTYVHPQDRVAWPGLCKFSLVFFIRFRTLDVDWNVACISGVCSGELAVVFRMLAVVFRMLAVVFRMLAVVFRMLACRIGVKVGDARWTT